jgi:hypothetical protein
MAMDRTGNFLNMMVQDKMNRSMPQNAMAQKELDFVNQNPNYLKEKYEMSHNRDKMQYTQDVMDWAVKSLNFIDPEEYPQFRQTAIQYGLSPAILPKRFESPEAFQEFKMKTNMGAPEFAKMMQGKPVTMSKLTDDGLISAVEAASPEEIAGYAKSGYTLGKLSGTPERKPEAILKYEYGLKNPQYLLFEKQKEDTAKIDSLNKQKFNDSSELRKEFVAQSADYQKVRDSYARVLNSTKEPSPAGDLALIFNYMKMLDPGSVVRESEFATAAQTGSYGQRIQAAAQKIMSGERLAPEMRADFVSQSKRLLSGMENQHKKRIQSYATIAKKNNLPVDEVVVDITMAADSGEDEDTPPVNLLKENTETEFENGQVWTIKNGKPERIK